MFVLETRKDTLLKPLQAAVGVVERKHTLPILANVLFEAVGERTALVATDLELQITTWMAEVCPEGTAFTVSARKLLDICRALPETEAIKLDLDAEQLKLRSGKSRFSLQTLPAQDFPRMQIAEGEGIRFSLPQGRLRRLMARVQYAMAVQDIRYYLNGMLISLQGDRLLVAATDGHRLALDATTLEGAQEQGMDVILPRKTVQELLKLLDDSEAPVEVQLARSQVMFAQSGFELRSKVVDGKFPDYQRVIPTGYEKVFTIERQRLSQALARTAILTNEKFRGVRLALTHGGLRLACSNNEQEEAQEELDVDYQNEPLDISFNVQYLQDVLNNLDCEAVRCSFGDASSSMLMTVPGEEHFRYVVMPMRI
jgi:DNA polymerase-3 subunit beta